jgi:hypothetical protein
MTRSEAQRALWRDPKHRAKLMAARADSRITFTPEMDEVTARLAASGASLDAIARRVGVSWGVLRNRIVALWIEERRGTQQAVSEVGP